MNEININLSIIKNKLKKNHQSCHNSKRMVFIKNCQNRHNSRSILI